MSDLAVTTGPTWKLVSFLKRRFGLSHDEFVEHWRHVHAPLMQQQADFWRHVRRYVQNPAHPEVSRGSESPIVGLADTHDGVSELWFDTFDELKAAVCEPGFVSVVKPAATEFVDLAGTVTLVAEYVLVKDTGRARARLFGAGHASPGLTREEAQRYWRGEHPGLIEREAPAFWNLKQYYGQNHVRSPEGVALDTVTDAYDLCAETGYETVAAMAAAFSLPEYMGIIRPDEVKFASVEEGLALITYATVIYDAAG
jgi:uncharacterized protein (TIGR02118 family)